MSRSILEILMAIFMSILSLWILKEYFSIFFDNRKKQWYFQIVWIAYFGWQMYMVLQLSSFPVYLNVAINIMFAFTISLTYEGNYINKVLFSVIYNSIWMMIEFLIGYIFMLVGIFYLPVELLGSLFSKMLLFILVEALKKFFENDNIQEISKSYNLSFMLIITGSMYLVYDSFMIRSNYGSVNMITSVLALIIALAINILMFFIYLKLSENLELKRKNFVYKQAIDLYDMHIKEKENSVKEVRRIKHDLKNQLIYMDRLVEQKKYSELEILLKELIEQEPFSKLLIANTDNSVVDALVNYKYVVANNNGIEFIVKLDIPAVLPFESSDLCIILGNALDNAIEANIRSLNNTHYIKLLMRLDNKNLMILVENSFEGCIKRNKYGKLITTKIDKSNHGIGMDSIYKAVEKYHGYINESFDEGRFQLRIVLYSAGNVT